MQVAIEDIYMDGLMMIFSSWQKKFSSFRHSVRYANGLRGPFLQLLGH